MEEINYKLKSKNVILITDGVERLLDLITEHNCDLEDQPMTYLKEQCISEDPTVSVTAGRGFLNLISRGYLDMGPALSIAMSMLPSAKNDSAITSIISGILGLIVEEQLSKLKEGDSYMSTWSLTSPLHPLVMVLNQHPSAINNILPQVESLCIYNQKIFPHSVELMRPIFLWILCDPNESQSSETYHKCINILRGLETCPKYTELILECLIWQQERKSRRSYFLTTYLLNMAVSTKKDELVYIILMVMADLAVECLHRGEDPRPYFTQIHTAINYPGVEYCSDILLTVLSEAVLICPPVYTFELITLCKNLLIHTKINISSFIFISTLVQWLYYPTSLSADFNCIAKSIIDEVIKLSSKGQNKHDSSNISKLNIIKMFHLFKSCHSRIFNYMEIFVNCDKIISNEETFNLWIDKFRQCNNLETKQQLVPFLCGVLLKKFGSLDCSVNKTKILHALQNLFDEKKELSVGLLPVVLYSLKQTKNPEEMVSLLQTLVHMAVAKENVPLIVQILENVRTEKLFPRSFLIHLYTKLVAKQTRCYPYLQEFLLDTSPNTSGDCEWEVLTAKALAVKFLCQERSANFGAEMVPIISGLFNRCSDTSSGTAYCFALEALKGLWENRIVAPAGTWKALAPKIGKDKRSLVQVGVCNLLGDIPGMQNKGSDYDLLVSSAVVKLWSYVVDSHHPEVTIAALDALGNFKLEEMTLKQIPEVYRKGLTLPRQYCKTPADAARKPEDVLNYIPGECWANLFKYTNQDAIEGVSNFCHKLIVREISEYRSGVYQQTSETKGEPESLAYLSPSSVVRGLMSFLRKEALSPSYDCLETSFVECLRCLSRKLPRPLPPMLWNFLPDLWARGLHYKTAIVPLAAQQAPISYSCTRFLQNYLPCLDVTPEKEDEFNKFLETLPSICKSIQPEFVRDTLYKIFIHSWKQNKTPDSANTKLFINVVTAMKECLQCNGISEENKIMISDIVEQSYEEFDVDDLLWPYFAELSCQLPAEYIERLTSPSSWWEVTSKVLRKAIYVRAILAVGDNEDNPLVWLNEVIDASIPMPREHAMMLQKLYEVMMKTCKGFEDWLLQLMARSSIHTTESSADSSSINYLCDILMLSVIMASGYYIYTWRDCDTLTTSKAARLSLFPQSLHHLLFKADNSKLKDSSAQILEWVHHTRSNKYLSPQYAECFYLALVACKYSAHTRKQNVWTKYLSVKPTFDIQ